MLQATEEALGDDGIIPVSSSILVSDHAPRLSIWLTRVLIYLIAVLPKVLSPNKIDTLNFMLPFSRILLLSNNQPLNAIAFYYRDD